MKANSKMTSIVAMGVSFIQMVTTTSAIGLTGNGQAMVNWWTSRDVSTKGSGSIVSLWENEDKNDKKIFE